MAQLSDEAARLDFPEVRARRLTDALGSAALSTERALEIYNAAEAVKNLALERRKAERNSATGDGGIDEELKDAIEKQEASIRNLENLLSGAGLPPHSVMRAVLEISKQGAERSRGDLMLESLLISAVSQFEVFVAKLMEISLLADDRPLVRSERKMTYGEVSQYPSMGAFRREMARNFLDTMMRNDLTAWMKFLGEATKVELSWVIDSLDEVIKRRNVHVHANGRASAQYIRTLGKKAAAVKEGDPLPVTFSYLMDATDRISEAALVISQAAVRALCCHIKDPELARTARNEENVVEGTFDLLVAGRFVAVAPLYARLEPLMATASAKESIRANSLHAKKALYGIDSTREEIYAWDVSSSADQLVLVRHCLLDETEQAAAIFKRLEAQGSMSVLELATWPILAPLRTHLLADNSE